MTYDSNMELVSDSEPAPVETPVEETPSTEEAPKTDETPAEETPKVEEPTLYETPDGRKVTADVLQKEWKENFLPEFTRKSQELADLKRDPNINNPNKDVPAWKREDYVPQNYAEVIELAKAEALAEMRNSAKAESDRVAAIQSAVETELSSLKTKDPGLDENALFAHANKYSFPNLSLAHANMTDMKKSAVEIEQRTVKNLKTREVDPISTGQGGEISEESGYDPNKMSQFEGAADYLKHLIKGK